MRPCNPPSGNPRVHPHRGTGRPLERIDHSIHDQPHPECDRIANPYFDPDPDPGCHTSDQTFRGGSEAEYRAAEDDDENATSIEDCLPKWGDHGDRHWNPG